MVCVCVCAGKGWERVAGGDGCAALTLNFKAKLVCLLFISSAGFPADNVSLMFISSLNYSNPAQVLGSFALSLEYICCFHNKSLSWCKAAFTWHCPRSASLISRHVRAPANFMKSMNFCILCFIMSFFAVCFWFTRFFPPFFSSLAFFWAFLLPFCLHHLLQLPRFVNLSLNILSCCQSCSLHHFHNLHFRSHLSFPVCAPRLILSDHDKPRRGVCAAGQLSEDQVESDQSDGERSHGPVGVFHRPASKPGGHRHSQQVSHILETWIGVVTVLYISCG